ncbi:hypothetical protein, partial [Stieleria mannarensis]|uniref:hypothetical protein n=1 Tax=Stieleria mannarensis TaxID=2755585 RepID=UPI001C7244DE
VFVGDAVIYCEIDSFLPVRDEFEFLRKSSLKTMDGREESAEQGELVGPGIQKSRYRLKETAVFVFNVFDVGVPGDIPNGIASKNTEGTRISEGSFSLDEGV